MNTAVLSGATLTLTAPGGGVLSGHAYQIGDLIVVATVDAAEGVQFTAACTGVYILAKATGQAWAEGQALYWDDGASKFTTDSASGANPLIGAAAMAAISAATTGWVRLGPPMGGSGGGAGLLLSETVAFTDDQIKALPIPGLVNIVPAVGANKTPLILSAYLKTNIIGAYADIGSDSVITVTIKPAVGSQLDATAYIQNDSGTGDELLTLFLTTIGINTAILNALSYASPESSYGGAAGLLAGDIDYSNASVELYIDNGGVLFSSGNPANTLTVTVYYVVVDL